VALREHSLGPRVATAGLLVVLGVGLLLALPALRPVVREIREMSPGWVAAAVALEVASSISYVVVFRLFFERVAPSDARALAWTSMASGALLPGGGVGGLAIGGWLLRLAGAPTRWIVRRSSGLFFLTSAVNSAAVIGAALLLLVGWAGPHDFPRAALPLLIAGAITLLVVVGAHAAGGGGARGGARGAAPTWLAGIAAGIADAERAVRHPSWRLAGALGYLGFDIAVLWATFSALGHAPPLPALTLGYSIGYLANALPIPGGIGALDAGLAGALLLYGAAPAHVAAAVLVYHAVALWVPAVGGLLAYARLRPRLARTATADRPAIAAAGTSTRTLEGALP
jgi:uncharacterized membrane protein YbhN (UPF0104 family)